MSDTKISALTEATSTDGTEVLPIVQSATTKKLAVSKIKDYLLAVANVFTKPQTFQPDSDAQAGTFRRYSSSQTANVIEVQTEANALLASVDKGGNATFPSLTLSGNISSAAWTTSGIGLKNSARTLTDTSSSGTVAAAYTNALGGNTIAASNVTTFTDYYSAYISDPVAGTNVTLTRKWSLGLAGSAAFGGPTLNVYNTGIGTANYERAKVAWESNVLRIGTEKGGTGTARAMELQTDGTTRLTLGTNGSTTTAGDLWVNSARFLGFENSTLFYSPSDGVLGIYNKATTSFGRLQFGGSTSSFPALKRNGTAINFRLADDSADAPLTASTLQAATAYTVATLPTVGTAGRIARVTDGDASLAWGATVVNSGSGATPYLVWDNGTAWTVLGK